MATNAYNFLREVENNSGKETGQILSALDNALFAQHLCHKHYARMIELLNGEHFSDFTAYVKTIIPFYGLVYVLLDCPETAEKWEEVIKVKEFSIYKFFNEYRNFVHEHNPEMSYAI